MNSSHCDILIAGGGLAGMAAAVFLAEDRDLLVVDGGRAGSGSLAANGIVNPFIGRRARPVWRRAEAVEAFGRLLERVDARHLYDDRGVLRTADDDETAERFRSIASANAGDLVWLDKDMHDARFPDVEASHGSLFAPRAGWVDVELLLNRMAAYLLRCGRSIRNARLAAWHGSARGILAQLEGSEGALEVQAETLVLAVGGAFSQFEEVDKLRLHAIKGQTVRLRTLLDTSRIPHIAGPTTIGFADGGVVVGSTYEHGFADLAPDPEATADLIARAVALAPCLAGATTAEVRTGVRATVPLTRNPMVGPLDEHRRVWVVSGLGSRGLLMAPLIGSRLREWLADPARVPDEIRVRRR